MAKTTAEKAKQEAAYAWHAKKVAGRRRPKAKPVQPTAAQIRMRKSEDIRKGYTPTGLQSLVDVMGKKKKRGQR